MILVSDWIDERLQIVLTEIQALLRNFSRILCGWVEGVAGWASVDRPATSTLDGPVHERQI